MPETINEIATPKRDSTGNLPDAPVSLPQDQDHCLKCNYSLKNLQTWRCPECSHITTEKERAHNQHYLQTANRFAARCIFIPTGIFAFFSVAVFLIFVVLREFNLENEELLILIPIVSVVYIVLQPWMLVFAAARLTQVQVMKRFSPSALSAEPTKAILLFLSHVAWMCLFPILTIILIFAGFFAGII